MEVIKQVGSRDVSNGMSPAQRDRQIARACMKVFLFPQSGKVVLILESVEIQKD